MSRIAKYPVIVPDGVTIELNQYQIIVQGNKGSLKQNLTNLVNVTFENNKIFVKPKNNLQHAIAMSGTLSALISNMVKGVSKGFERKLLLVGVGFRATILGNSIKLQLGYSHDINYQLPVGIVAECPSQTEIILKGADKQVVGQAAAKIRAYRPPEQYKGKGVRYSDEHVIIKETKKK
ncbi:50S ribosomal protein L6 [Candidatus Kinetoplastibacterium sorsogonicusi]|uniref:Large ribosomal subunit protein uL6 n=1 Tax=Candidatus Kinetoplastidibacterium kentomonadis TaxID=1576550 RepID=A0A3Q8ES18_9PROT|nr:50S ribosomal protein L6 [Candidatus Kinetoplastibacterium sorsogonicusi]AWD32782.1 50S ribosomal protein L6 [Candidatus Kinetoplastibacterium sorsogonicusi]